VIRVLLADDHVPTRAGVRAALEEDGFEVVSESGSGGAALAGALFHRPDVCVLDIHMPGGDGVEAATAIRDALPDTAIVMLTVSEEDQDLFRALRAGAAGYLLKDTDPDRLGAALRGVLDGEAAIPRLLMARIVEEFRHRDRRRLPMIGRPGLEFTDREREVFELLRERKTTKEIGLALGVSEITVRRHVSGIVGKLGVPGREAAIAAVEEAEQRRR
jgi:DNA-binding NarL/FixJ family response regulator